MRPQCQGWRDHADLGGMGWPSLLPAAPPEPPSGNPGCLPQAPSMAGALGAHPCSCWCWGSHDKPPGGVCEAARRWLLHLSPTRSLLIFSQSSLEGLTQAGPSPRVIVSAQVWGWHQVPLLPSSLPPLGQHRQAGGSGGAIASVRTSTPASWVCVVPSAPILPEAFVGAAFCEV